MANPLKLLKLKPTGFQFIQEVKIDASPAAAWKALLNAGGWFRFENPQGQRPKVTLDARLGGLFMSKTKGGSEQRLFGHVSYIEPGKLLRINGSMGITHLPVSSAIIFELQPRANGKATTLRMCHRAFGYLTSDQEKGYKGGWKQLLPQIKTLAEGRRRSTRKSK
jgi:uncharacterized protein YndB with AHSA1/START domain